MSKCAVIIPVFNAASFLPGLFEALEKSLKISRNTEVFFVENCSTDKSLNLLKKFCRGKKSYHLLEEGKKGWAYPLNRGVQATKSFPMVLFLDADALPDSNWIEKMQEALLRADVAVGNTETIAREKKDPWQKMAIALFKDYSEKTATGESHSLPWGPTSNLGMRRELLDQVGPFSLAAKGALDIDWCWRAFLSGGRIRYAPEAKVKHYCKTNRDDLLAQFERFGFSEGWLQRTYHFLPNVRDENQSPRISGIQAFQRLRWHSKATPVKKWIANLEELAICFSFAVRSGFEKKLEKCPHTRVLPKKILWWQNEANKILLFHPKKGMAQLPEEWEQTWLDWQAGEPESVLIHNYAHAHHISLALAKKNVLIFLKDMKA